MSAGALLSGLISRNVTVRGRRTSMRLEASMWEALNEICRRERVRVADICTHLAAAKSPALTLTAALRVFIANYFRDAATEEGHARAGHGVGPPNGPVPRVVSSYRDRGRTPPA